MGLNNAQLQTLVLQLQEQVKALDPDPTLATQIEQLRVSHKHELSELKADYERKIVNLEDKLNAVINATSSTTISCVSGFFDKLDKKISEALVNIDTQEAQILKNEVNITAVSEKLKTEPRASVTYKPNNNEVINNNSAVSQTATASSSYVSLDSLEARIDKLEDYSRRDNLLFSGFEEEEKEHCENKVRDLLARKIFYSEKNVNVNNIVIVRAHRLGRYKAGQTRPIIVKFREFSDKQLILQQIYKGKLINTGKWASEDFSVNTTEDRKYLRGHLNAAKDVLNGRIKSSSIRYKAIHVANTSGKRFVFPLHKVEKNPQTWWKVIGMNGSEDEIQQYPEGASKPEDIQDIAEEAPTDEVDQDSDGTQNSVEQPKEVAVPTGTAEDGNAP